MLGDQFAFCRNGATTNSGTKVASTANRTGWRASRPARFLRRVMKTSASALPSRTRAAIGSQGRGARKAGPVPHPPFNPSVRFSRTQLTDDLLDMITQPSGIGWCP